MTHLSSDELLAFAENGSRGGGHLESCATCRARLEALRDVLALAREADVPEPSPLFWTHFSERVKQEIAAEPAPASSSRRARLGVLWPVGLASAFAAAFVAVLVFRTATPPASDEVTSRAGASVDLRDESVAPQTGVPEDASWSLVTDLAADLDLDTASEAGLVIRPGSTERAISQLSEDERRVVTELLQEELARAKL